MAILLCVITVIEGILLLIIDFLSFVYQKITVGVGLCWGGFAVIVIALGAVPGLSGWSRVFPAQAVPAFLLISFSITFSLFYLSCAVSQLLRKNQELAMHVSLLNQENETLLAMVKKLQKNSMNRKTESVSSDSEQRET